MRIMIKGGVWKNTEDEILKAAVMKYGLNQWARISSLLTRKSAKQCKARWYEWLDPEIKKTEWTKEEDEKLLHLAKLFPTQWRTIAPIVGRTSAQCLERYEKLLDLALSKDASYDPDDDPRRLRPGEIDPNPESKPARPDPVDMDEDEKEMLSEARARLANTRGKKAKRKAREKQLEEARRLAFMQKNRELRAAGIELRFRDKIRRGLDYNREVAFEKKPPIGFYDTTKELKQTNDFSKEFRPVALQNAEIKSRKHVEEALMKQDVRRQKILADHNQPAALEKSMQLNDPGINRRRSKLLLPEPQVSEEDLLQIAKTGTSLQIDEDMIEGAGGDVTRKLLGQYDPTSSLLSFAPRTPRTQIIGGDKILQEAHNLALMQSVETPLLGQANPSLFPSNFESVIPKRDAASTPNPLTLGSALETPLSSRGDFRTPLRDALGLNASDTASVTSTVLDNAQRLMHKNQLKAQLSQLPEPKNEAEITLSSLPFEDDELCEEEMEMDAVDADAMKLNEERELTEAVFKRKTKILQRGLPRPLNIENALMNRIQSTTSEAEKLLAVEMVSLLKHESITDPINVKKRKKSKKRSKTVDDSFQYFDAELLEDASVMIEEEMQSLREDDTSEEFHKEYEEAWHALDNDVTWLHSQNGYGRISTASEKDRVQALKDKLQSIRSEMQKETKRAQKREDKVKIICAGHWSRHSTMMSSLHASWKNLCQELIDLESYSRLKSSEDGHADARLSDIRDRVEQQRDYEKQLQREYKSLLEEENVLRQRLNSDPGGYV